MTTPSPRDLAERLITAAVNDTDVLGVHDWLEGEDDLGPLTGPQLDRLAEQIEDEIGRAEITVTWPKAGHRLTIRQRIENEGAKVLATPMGDNEAEADTVRGYLVALAAGVWAGGEGFSGKRPFGSSGWHSEVYRALAKAGHVEATFDENGYLDVDTDRADELIRSAIRALGSTPAAESEDQ